MGIAERVAKYRAIEQMRSRPLIVYATSTRPGVNAMFSVDAVREFIDQVDTISGGSSVDILLHSYGGDALAAWKIMSILRERFERVGVLVPAAAFSAATIFALGADEIVMHPHASLGPTDPQITVKAPDGKIRQFAYEDLIAFLGFLRDEMRLTDQDHVKAVVDRLFGAVDPLFVGGARRASELSLSVGERMLLLHMKDDRRARQIAVNLGKSFFAHGDAVSRTRAKTLDLQVADANPALESAIWEAYLEIEEHMQFRRPFNHLAVYLSAPGAAASIALPAPVSLPANTPPIVIQQVWQQVVNQALQSTRASAIEVPYEVVVSVVESTRLGSEQKAEGRVSVFRQEDMSLKIVMAETNAGYQRVPIGTRDASEMGVATGANP